MAANLALHVDSFMREVARRLIGRRAMAPDLLFRSANRFHTHTHTARTHTHTHSTHTHTHMTLNSLSFFLPRWTVVCGVPVRVPGVQKGSKGSQGSKGLSQVAFPFDVPQKL